MRARRIITVLFWATWSAICAAGLVYLGSGTERYQARWPVAAGAGAILGAAGGLVALRLWGNRRGVLLMGLLFGVLQAILMCGW
jgi:proteasome assembly chaperone (PAC2) family protein